MFSTKEQARIEGLIQDVLRYFNAKAKHGVESKEAKRYEHASVSALNELANVSHIDLSDDAITLSAVDFDNETPQRIKKSYKTALGKRVKVGDKIRVTNGSDFDTEGVITYIEKCDVSGWYIEFESNGRPCVWKEWQQSHMTIEKI